MAISKDDLNAFHQFALGRVEQGSVQSFHELIDLWNTEHPNPERHADDVAAIRAAVRDMENGDAGRPAMDVIKELHEELSPATGSE